MRGIKAYLPTVVKLWQDRLDELRSGRVPLEQLLVTQKLSRELEQYTVPSPPVRAVVQLQSVGKEVKVGQYVRFLYTIGEPGVHARVVLLSSGCLNQGDIIQAHHHCITKRIFCFGWSIRKAMNFATKALLKRDSSLEHILIEVAYRSRRTS